MLTYPTPNAKGEQLANLGQKATLREQLDNLPTLAKRPRYANNLITCQPSTYKPSTC
ncbi:MAG: hypothetical protein F6J94_12800 [Moorea sp. SIO1F2]|uniref:hypothetical protein n=1 Tax=Moorena sp. SIO1F2 TaxID=2607819 RepID=UPI0013B77B19|nr:hypothetical protein [Moorena sp. SIO1F2]NET82769.1 hypothetical protein [Moorena sp. SIO1F2]